MRQFLRTTIVGGAVFLLPLVLIVLLLGYAIGAAAELVQPVLNAVGVDPLEDFAGIALVTLIAIAALILVCFVSGFFARTAFGSAITDWIERSVLGRMPQYQVMKSVAAAFAQLENTQSLSPALVSVEGGWQLGYVMEPLENGWLAVFLPQAPSPMSGNVMYLPPERVRPLGITMMEATSLVQRLGIGSAAALRGVEMAKAGPA